MSDLRITDLARDMSEKRTLRYQKVAGFQAAMLGQRSNCYVISAIVYIAEVFNTSNVDEDARYG